MKRLYLLVFFATSIVAAVPVLLAQDSEEPYKVLMQRASELNVEEMTEYLGSQLKNGKIKLMDIQKAVQRSFGRNLEREAYERLHVLASAALNSLKPEYIREQHAIWNPKQADDEKEIKKTSDFLHAFFLSWNGNALMELGNADEAIENYKAIINYTEKNYFGQYNFPLEGKLAQALNTAGRYEEALDVIASSYAIDGSPWMDTVFNDAYQGAGLDPTKKEDYVRELRLKYSPEMPSVTFVDYQGNEVSLDDIRGEVTLITTWFPGCAGCGQEMPFLQELYEKYHDQGLNVAAIEITQNTEQADEYRKEHYGFAKFPFYENLPQSDQREVLMRSLGCRGNATYVIDRDNRIVLMWSGYGEHLNDPLGRRVEEALGMKMDAEKRSNH